MILKAVLSMRWFWNSARGVGCAPIRLHSRSISTEKQDLLANATRLLGSELGRLLQKVDLGHPLIGMAKHCASHDVDASCKSVVISVSKAINGLHHGKDEGTVFAAQELLADLTGMIHKAYLIHLTVTDTSQANSDNDLGNKIAILSGDYFLAKACLGLAHLQNTHVVEIMSSAICDMVERTFAQLKMDSDPANRVYSNPTNVTVHSQRDSIIRKYHSRICNYYSRICKNIGTRKIASNLLFNLAACYRSNSGDDIKDYEIGDGVQLIEGQFSSLLAKSCQCSAILGGYNSAVQQLASDFAMHLSLAEQFSCLSTFEPEAETQLVPTARVAITGGLAHAKTINNDGDWRVVMAKAAHELCLLHSNQCLDLLQRFPMNEATQELKNFIPLLGNNCT